MLALISGRGALPSAVAAAQKVSPLICAMEGFEPDGLKPDLTFRLETLGTLLVKLTEQGITEVCLCGVITRPEVDPNKLDIETLPLVPKFMEALQKGDDGALRAVMKIFEEKGFAVLAAQELLPELTSPKGIPTLVKPEACHEMDALVGESVLAEMGKADLGQACIIRQGEVLAREQLAGTDAMLTAFAEHYSPNLSGQESFDFLSEPASRIADAINGWIEGSSEARVSTGAVLFKAPKPGQDRRADLPTIGPKTAMMAAEAGLDGIIIEAEGVIVLQEELVLRILDSMGMFLWVR